DAARSRALEGVAPRAGLARMQRAQKREAAIDLDGDLTFSALSVRCRLLNRVDHEQFDRAPRRFELQPELFLKGGKDRGIVGQVWRCAERREHQRESEHARQAGLVDDWPINTGGF